MRLLLPLFLDISGRDVLLVGGGPVAASKLRQLIAAGACVTVVAPEVVPDIESCRRASTLRPDGRVVIARREFAVSDLDTVWLVVAAATPAVNRQVADAAEARRVFVNAVDDPANATAYLSGVVRRDGITLAISTSGVAPALTSLLREALDALLPADLSQWIRTAREQRAIWRRDGVAMGRRKPQLLDALNRRYAAAPATGPGSAAVSSPAVPGLHAPEDSWL